MLRPLCVCQTLNGFPKVHLSPFEMLHSEVTILELERGGFLPFEVYLIPNSFLFLFFSIRKFFRFIRGLFSIFSRNFQKLYFFIFSETD